MSTVCIIPARGGSKRIPRKNVRLFAGLPMIAHSIRAAQRSGVFDRITVSTDDDEIMEVAREEQSDRERTKEHQEGPAQRSKRRNTRRDPVRGGFTCRMLRCVPDTPPDSLM